MKRFLQGIDGFKSYWYCSVSNFFDLEIYCEHELPSPSHLAWVALTPLEELQAIKHPEDITLDAWAMAIALRTLYLRAIVTETNQGGDSEVIVADLEKTKPVSYLFIGEQLKGLENVIKETRSKLETKMLSKTHEEY